MFSNEDDNQGLVLGVVFALIALVIALVIGVGIYKKNRFADAPAAAGVAATPAAVAGPLVVNTDAASVIVENGVVKFYFASGQFALAAGGAEALAQVVSEVGNGKRAVVSGFHDATGSAAANAELARRRAQAVRDALQSLGVSAEKIELKKPEQMQGDGSNAEARRVEVAVQ
ncbi:OmpA family protein [Polaromonas sp.]|jgi:outer membrane protein OmpA-like peptidoglycan-associated protein|uniref:OmpA family protein n=1 Tax=Polaromonas sp. TaxID=1869339 RepID=UPI002D01A39F|nr:OmpA family protein [Polaromonas sp.]HQS31454.1 OmpA family protein [Polaromonas sp.]HQS90789.1 OmpA family protein [Polaromonas sp.]